MKKIFRFALFSGLFITLSWFFVIQASANTTKDEPPRLSVRGNATLNVPADRLNLDIGVSAAARQAEDALRAVSLKQNDIIKALEKTGLGKKEYRTRRFEVRPQWSSRPKGADRDWCPQIVGFSASSSLSIRTLKLDLGGQLIEAAASAGANNIGSLYFDLADPRKYRDQAIQKAAENALADAQTLAKAVGVEIIRVMSLDLDHSRPTPIRMNYERGGVMKAMAAAEAPAIVAGDVSVQASVTMVCEIGVGE